ncbi:MAG TPA: XrtA system polysaccharide chain length determinant [Stellaceae bacterium]|nr:XrtA system polysaccharide chain length determinant [Stellaceae bacterium]
MLNARTMVLRHARALWRRRWYGLAVAWAVCIAGWAFVAHLPDLYEARARIYVDTDSMLRPLLRGIAVDTNMLSQVDIMQRTLLSRPNLQKVSHMADLDLAARTPVETDAVVDNLREHISVESQGQNLFSLSYVGPNRETATKVVQSLLTVFVESNLGSSRQDMLSARSFIDDQLSDYAKQLDNAEKRIADFKAANVGFLPGQDSYGAKLDAARQALDKTQAELEENLQKRQAFVTQLASVPKYVDSYTTGPDQGFGAGPPLSSGNGGSGSDAASADAQTRVALLQQRLNVLLEDYTDQYPDVVKVKRELEQAKARAKAEQSDKSSDSGEPVVGPGARRSTAPNPVYEQLQLQLVALDSTIASLKARAQREATEVKKWDALAKSVPEVGAQLSKLTRDYDVIKKAYDELLNRRESAKIGSDLATQTQTVQFRIIDPPQAPPIPVAPKRGLLLSVVMIGGIIAGAAFAYLLSQIDDSVMTIRELRELVGAPVLGAITFVVRPFDRRQRRFDAVGFAALCVALLAVFIGIYSFEILGRPFS